MGKLTPPFINNMSFDEKVKYLLNANLVGDIPDYLYNTVKSVILEYSERIDEKNEIYNSLRKEIRELKEILEDNIDDNAELQEKNIKLKLRVKRLEDDARSIFDCSTMEEVKYFVLNTDLKDLNIANTDRLFELKSKLNLDIMVLSDALEVLNSMKNAGNFVNKYFEGD